MYTVKFKEVYSKNQYKVNQDTLDLQFFRDICAGNARADKYFNETTIYGSKVFLDAPNGRFDGIARIGEFAKNWLKDFKASGAEIYPVIQTIANGRVCNEIEVWFHLNEGGIKKVPMVVFSDPIGQDKLEGMRIYFFFKFLDGAIAYRRPIFRPRFNSWCEPALLTGVIRYYYEQLHNYNTEEAFNNIIEMCTDDIVYGGYRPDEEESIAFGKEQIKKHYTGICKNTPSNCYVRFETICDDGVNCCVEWTGVTTRKAFSNGMMTSIAGSAMYERAKNGKLYSIRICDNAGYDLGIDTNSIPKGDLFIDG